MRYYSLEDWYFVNLGQGNVDWDFTCYSIAVDHEKVIFEKKPDDVEFTSVVRIDGDSVHLYDDNVHPDDIGILKERFKNGRL